MNGSTRTSLRGLRPGSQNARIVAYLADGRWHRSDDVHRAVFCVLHSRIAEINRKPGYVIEHRGEGAGADKHFYRLVATPGGALTERGTASDNPREQDRMPVGRDTGPRSVSAPQAHHSDAWATRPDSLCAAGSGRVPVSVAASDLQLELPVAA